jgi:isocitrate dehydrogenase
LPAWRFRLLPEHSRRCMAAGFDAVKTENLYEFEGVRGYSRAQGE